MSYIVTLTEADAAAEYLSEKQVWHTVLATGTHQELNWVKYEANLNGCSVRGRWPPAIFFPNAAATIDTRCLLMANSGTDFPSKFIAGIK